MDATDPSCQIFLAETLRQDVGSRGAVRFCVKVLEKPTGIEHRKLDGSRQSLADSLLSELAGAPESPKLGQRHPSYERLRGETLFEGGGIDVAGHQSVVNDTLHLVVAIAQRSLYAADSPGGDDGTARLVREMLEDPVFRRFVVVREKTGDELLRSPDASVRRPTVLLECQAKLGNGCTQVIAGLVHGSSFDRRMVSDGTPNISHSVRAKRGRRPAREIKGADLQLGQHSRKKVVERENSNDAGYDGACRRLPDAPRAPRSSIALLAANKTH